jgi:hypothetical protein
MYSGRTGVVSVVATQGEVGRPNVINLRNGASGCIKLFALRNRATHMPVGPPGGGRDPEISPKELTCEWKMYLIEKSNPEWRDLISLRDFYLLDQKKSLDTGLRRCDIFLRS